MARYVKKTFVDAVQWFKDGDSPYVMPLEGGSERGFLLSASTITSIVNPGDWIVVTDEGKRGVYTQHQFDKLFQAVPDE